MNHLGAIGGRPNLPALCAGGLLALSMLAALPVGAAELVMFRVPGCQWCQAWDREVGDAYTRSPEAETVPLREVRLDKDRDGGLELARRVRYTPTFVLARDGVEVGRIEGYPGEAFFWSRLDQLLDQLLEQLGGAEDTGASPSSTASTASAESRDAKH